MVAPRELDVIRGAARPFAQRAEVEPDRTRRDPPRQDLAAFDLELDVGRARLPRYAEESFVQSAIGGGVEGMMIDARARQRPQPVVAAAVELLQPRGCP